MRQEKHLIKWHAQSGWDIREDQKLKKVSHEGDPKAISFPRAKLQMGYMISLFQWIKVCGAELSERMQDEKSSN